MEFVYDPREFGAAADGVSKDTAAVQKAIDTAAAHGGIVRLAGGASVAVPCT